MERWAGEGNDWIKLMAQQKLLEEDVIHSLLASMRQAVEMKTDGTRPTKKQRELPHLELERPGEGKKLTFEIKGNNKTIVDWVNGHATLKTRESTVTNNQNLPREWWCQGFPPRQRIAGWATHIFREHNKEADPWAAKGVKGRVGEWVDTAHVVWSEVTSLCGFWDGSCDNGNCGAVIMIMACSEVLGWFPIYKKCGPVVGPVLSSRPLLKPMVGSQLQKCGSVTGQNSLDAELGCCGMLMENLRPWVGKSVR